jgi:hypothetical protein
MTNPLLRLAPRLRVAGFAACAAAVLGAPAAGAQSGTAAAEFLDIPVGARATAMGGAFGATASDGTALYWNPAGIARLPERTATFEYAQWYVGVDVNYAAVTTPTRFGSVGVGITAVRYDDMDVISETTNDQEPTGETFSAGSYAVSLSYARSLTDRFALGGTVKLVREQIANSAANGVAFDVGTLFTTPFQGVRLGASIQNFGSKMRMSGSDLNVPFDPLPGQNGNNGNVPSRIETDRYDFPLVMRVGLASEVYEQAGTRVTVAVDALAPSAAAQHLNVGAEVGLLGGLVQVRGGYQELFMAESDRSFTLGGGLRYEFGRLNLAADYAYEASQYFSGVNRLAFALQF